MESLFEFIANVEINKLGNSTKIYFSRKNNTDYLTHQPAIASSVQTAVLQTVLPYIKTQLMSHEIVAYNPVGVLDGQLEKIKTSEIPMYNDFLESISENTILKEMSSLKIDKIAFYCIEVSFDDKKMYIFRQFQKLKKLRSGILTRIVNDELNVIENDFLGIDEFSDIVAFDNELYLFNHISLERIFSYKDEFLKKTNEALGEILSKNIISNIEQFSQDCRNDIRIMKRFTNIMTKDRLPMFFDNYERVPEIVKDLELDIEFDEDGKMIYRERSQLFHIVNLLSDSYFKSLLAERKGIAVVEGEI